MGVCENCRINLEGVISQYLKYTDRLHLLNAIVLTQILGSPD